MRWLVLLLMLPAVARAQFDYTTNNGTLTVTGYTGPGGAVAIPDTINGLPVTTIGGYVFYNRTSLTSVTIPNSVTSIGLGAFLDCTSLTSVTIPGNVTSIEGAVFSGCTSLTSVTIPGGVTGIGEGTFYRCTSLSSVRIPSGVSNIGRFAFSYCSSLTSVTIPSSVTKIDNYAFLDCTRLTSVTIPDSVTLIGDWAFRGCIGLTNVTISDSVTDIGSDAFYHCSSLANVVIPGSVTNIAYGAFSGCTSLLAINVDVGNSRYASVDGVLFNKSRTTLIQCPGGKTGNYTIPSSVISIGGEAFYSCTSLTSVTIPSSVIHIGYAFGSCTSLQRVDFLGIRPSIVGIVEELVFPGATNATIYYLPGTTGWGPTFGGRPTALWKPLVQAGDSSFGVRTNQFGFNISWASGRVVVVEACTDLAQPIWTPVGTNTLTDGSSYFSDPQWTNHPARFYRLRSP